MLSLQFDITLLVLIVLLSLLISTIVIRNSSKSTLEIQRYFHLIEQNINIAKLNLDTSINEVSHSLARLLNTTKEEILALEINPFFGTDEKQISEILKTIKSAKQYRGEVRIQDAEHKNLWLDIDIQPSLDNNFNIIGHTMIIHNITSKKLLEVISITDGMTGLFNRREFDNTFEKRLNLIKREETLLVFMMLDIDYFKLYNDNYGHQAGDFALKSVAKAIKSTFSRPDDIVYRLGGEEFGVLFSTLNKEGASIMAQKILDTINNLKLKHEFSNVGNYISVSLGVGIIQATHESTLNIENIYADVDETLYKAKDNGRNRYEIISIS